MNQLVVRRLPEAVKEGLRARAGRHGRSLEAEVRDILERAVAEERRTAVGAPGLGSRIAALFADTSFAADTVVEIREPARIADFSE